MEADAKEMGGHISHEYHFLSSIGEESLQTCLSCGKSSKQLPEDQAVDHSKCTECHSEELEKQSGIEVNNWLQ